MENSDEKKRDRGPETEAVIKYDTPRGEITLTISVVRSFFLADANPTEALTFMGFCKHTGLNPFLREVYLVRYEQGSPASIVVAASSFLKRASRCREYEGYRAGIVIAPVEETAPKVSGLDDVAPAPFLAIEGALAPPKHELVGGWCQVYLKNRKYPVTAVVDLKEYQKKRRDNTLTRFWREMPATMIRKVSLGAGHREAVPDEVAGMYLEEEIAGTTEDLPVAPVTVEAKPDPIAIPEMLVPLFEQLEWSRGKVEMWLSRHREKTEAALHGLLTKELGTQVKTTQPVETKAEPVEPAPAGPAKQNLLNF